MRCEPDSVGAVADWAGPLVPRPSTEPVTAQCRGSNTAVIMVAGQKVALGRQFAHHTVTVHVSQTTLAMDYAGD